MKHPHPPLYLPLLLLPSSPLSPSCVYTCCLSPPNHSLSCFSLFLPLSSSPSLPPSCVGRDSQQVPVTDAESDRLRGSSRRHDRGSREEQQQTARETHPQERDSDVCGPLAQESGEKVCFLQTIFCSKKLASRAGYFTIKLSTSFFTWLINVYI